MKKKPYKKPRRTPIWMSPGTKAAFNVAHGNKEAQLGIVLTKDAALSLILSDLGLKLSDLHSKT
jgi:hypothetical protein